MSQKEENIYDKRILTDNRFHLRTSSNYKTHMN